MLRVRLRAPRGPWRSLGFPASGPFRGIIRGAVVDRDTGTDTVTDGVGIVFLSMPLFLRTRFPGSSLGSEPLRAAALGVTGRKGSGARVGGGRGMRKGPWGEEGWNGCRGPPVAV